VCNRLIRDLRHTGSIFSVASIAASWWTNWGLRCCCVLPSGELIEVPVIRLDLTSITPGGYVSEPWLAVVEP